MATQQRDAHKALADFHVPSGFVTDTTLRHERRLVIFTIWVGLRIQESCWYLKGLEVRLALIHTREEREWTMELGICSSEIRNGLLVKRCRAEF